MTTREDAATDTLYLTRRFKASRERVFAAFASLEAMGSWFGPPGCTVSGDVVDFREGGLFRIRAKKDGEDIVVSGTYREITSPEKIVFTWKWEDDEDWVNVESVITLEFKSDGPETEMNLTQSGFPSAESRGRHGHGWGVCFGKLDECLAQGRL